jgi:hypothetical protein
MVIPAMQHRRCALETCWSFTACLVVAVVAGGGCASPLTGPVTGLVDLEPHKARDAKAPKSSSTAAIIRSSDGSESAGDLTTTSAETDAMIGVAVDCSRPPAGSGFPPLGAAQSVTAHDADFAALAAEMQALGTLPPAEQQALLADLRQSDPALWPQLVRQFRAAMAYGRGQGPGARGQEATDGGQGAGDKKQGDEASSSDVPAMPVTVDVHTLPVAATAKSQTASLTAVPTAATEIMPSQPPLRPPLKAAERKAGELAVTAKPPDAASTKAVAKGPVAPSAASDERQLQLTKAILAMEGESAGSTAAADEVARQVRLRMLYLAAGRRDDALRPIPGLSAAQQEFWTKEMYGLATYLDADSASDPQRRAAEAALHLREAAARIGELASPVVRNLVFCKEVTSFGVFKRFPKDEFKAGDEALLYCEIENLKAESTDKGYRTSLKSSYQILDARGERVSEQEFPASEDVCTSQRRDFFIPYFIWIPKRIDQGTYTLQLTVEDMQTHKSGQASIQFLVK